MHLDFGAPGKLSEIPKIIWSPGGLGKDHIHHWHKEYEKMVFTGMDTEEEEYYNEAQREGKWKLQKIGKSKKKRNLQILNKGIITVG